MKRNMLVSAALAGLLGAGAVAAMTSPAAAYTTRRCDAYGCWVASCDWDGDNCHRVWDRDNYYDRRHYYSHSGYYEGNHWVPGYDRDWHNRRWVCDSDGDDCHWAYESY